MNETIEMLILEIKQQQCYKEYVEVSKKLEDVQDLLNRYQEAQDRWNEVAKYATYIDTTNEKEELKKVKQELANHPIIQEYYQKYHELNDYLSTITHIVFDDISDSLDLTGFQL